MNNPQGMILMGSFFIQTGFKWFRDSQIAYEVKISKFAPATTGQMDVMYLPL
jgi:hypothetical protein